MSLVNQKVTNHLDYNDFERIVQEVYGQRYEFVADEEASNYMSKSYNGILKGGENYRLDWQKDIEKFKNTGHYSYLAQTLLYDLVQNDYIPEGDYVIEVSW